MLVLEGVKLVTLRVKLSPTVSVFSLSESAIAVIGISGVVPGSVGSYVCESGICAGLLDVYLESLATMTFVPTGQL